LNAGQVWRLRLGFGMLRFQVSGGAEVFHASVKVLRRHRFGALPEAEGLRRTGHLWVEGYLATPVG